MNKKLLFSSSLVLATALLLTTTILINNKHSVIVSGDDAPYTLLLDENQKITSSNVTSENEISNNVFTNNHNQISLSGLNIINNDDGWQIINPHGYIYNPVSSVGNNNKISGIKSIKYTSDVDNSLSLYYGYSINNTEIIYSLKEVLHSNTAFTFNDHYPSYFYLENESNNPIDIDSLSIKYSCNEETYPYQNLNVLMIGNSFADDTLFYEARIAQSYGININLFNSYIGGCTVTQHYNNLLNDSASYSMRRMNGNSWDYSDNMTLNAILNHKTWDIITFQQASAEVGRSSSYSNLTNLVNEVINRIGYTPRLMWHQTWAYDQDYSDYYDYFSYFNNDQIAMYDAIIDCYENQVSTTGLFERIIPAGTAVQNLRTSYMRDTFSRDGKHMSSTHGRYLLGLDFLSSVYGIDLVKSPCTYIPFDINQSFVNVATECVQNAISHPLEITSSNYTSQAISTYDLSNYTEIDAGLVGCSYWDALDASNYNKRIQNNSGVSNLYVSTSRFTPTTLPVGSIVSIDEAFGVSLQTWTSDSQQVGTMQETYNNIIEINNDFWNGFAYRAFNIFKAGKTSLADQYVNEQYDEIFDGFHIYVPNESLGDLKTKTANPYYDSDKTVMANATYNIDAYERVHLDPIIGYFKCDSDYSLTNHYVDDTAKKFVCTRPFYGENDLPENSIIILDSGYQYRSDCWGNKGTYSPRPNNVTSRLTVIGHSFWENFRRRTFNVSSTSGSYVNQNSINFIEHMRIYVPISDDIHVDMDYTATMTALGYATLNESKASAYGKADIPVLVTLHGDSTNKVSVLADGIDINATSYTYDISNGSISILTTGSIGLFDFGTISGTLDKDTGTIGHVSANGSISSYLTNNGNITISEMFFDRCNYSTNAASQNVWQRWYMSGSWTANSGSGDWTTSDSTYRLDSDYSMGLRIAPQQYYQTRFTLKSDFNNGSGISPHGLAIWLYNPNGNIYSSFRIYVYDYPSSYSGGHAVPNSNYSHQTTIQSYIPSNQWTYYKVSLNEYGTIYNISLFFQTNCTDTTFVYLGHLSIY